MAIIAIFVCVMEADTHFNRSLKSDVGRESLATMTIMTQEVATYLCYAVTYPLSAVAIATMQIRMMQAYPLPSRQISDNSKQEWLVRFMPSTQSAHTNEPNTMGRVKLISEHTRDCIINVAMQPFNLELWQYLLGSIQADVQTVYTKPADQVQNCLSRLQVAVMSAWFAIYKISTLHTMPEAPMTEDYILREPAFSLQIFDHAMSNSEGVVPYTTRRTRDYPTLLGLRLKLSQMSTNNNQEILSVSMYTKEEIQALSAMLYYGAMRKPQALMTLYSAYVLMYCSYGTPDMPFSERLMVNYRNMNSMDTIYETNAIMMALRANPKAREKILMAPFSTKHLSYQMDQIGGFKLTTLTQEQLSTLPPLDQFRAHSPPCWSHRYYSTSAIVESFLYQGQSPANLFILHRTESTLGNVFSISPSILQDIRSIAYQVVNNGSSTFIPRPIFQSELIDFLSISNGTFSNDTWEYRDQTVPDNLSTLGMGTICPLSLEYFYEPLVQGLYDSMASYQNTYHRNQTPIMNATTPANFEALNTPPPTGDSLDVLLNTLTADPEDIQHASAFYVPLIHYILDRMEGTHTPSNDSAASFRIERLQCLVPESTLAELTRAYTVDFTQRHIGYTGTGGEIRYHGYIQQNVQERLLWRRRMGGESNVAPNIIALLQRTAGEFLKSTDYPQAYHLVFGNALQSPSIMNHEGWQNFLIALSKIMQEAPQIPAQAVKLFMLRNDSQTSTRSILYRILGLGAHPSEAMQRMWYFPWLTLYDNAALAHGTQRVQRIVEAVQNSGHVASGERYERASPPTLIPDDDDDNSSNIFGGDGFDYPADIDFDYIPASEHAIPVPLVLNVDQNQPVESLIPTPPTPGVHVRSTPESRIIPPTEHWTPSPLVLNGAEMIIDVPMPNQDTTDSDEVATTAPSVSAPPTAISQESFDSNGTIDVTPPGSISAEQAIEQWAATGRSPYASSVSHTSNVNSFVSARSHATTKSESSVHTQHSTPPPVTATTTTLPAVPVSTTTLPTVPVSTTTTTPPASAPIPATPKPKDVGRTIATQAGARMVNTGTDPQRDVATIATQAGARMVDTGTDPEAGAQMVDAGTDPQRDSGEDRSTQTLPLEAIIPRPTSPSATNDTARELSTLRAQYGDLHDEAEGLRNEKQRQDQLRKAQELQFTQETLRQKQHYEAQVQEAQAQLERETFRTQRMQREINVLEQELRTIDSDLQSTSKRASQLETDVSREKSKSAELQSTLDTTIRENTEKQDKWKEAAKAKLGELKEQLRQSKDMIATMQQEASEYETEIGNKTSEAYAANKRAELAESRLADMQRDRAKAPDMMDTSTNTDDLEPNIPTFEPRPPTSLKTSPKTPMGRAPAPSWRRVAMQRAALNADKVAAAADTSLTLTSSLPNTISPITPSSTARANYVPDSTPRTLPALRSLRGAPITPTTTPQSNADTSAEMHTPRSDVPSPSEADFATPDSTALLPLATTSPGDARIEHVRYFDDQGSKPIVELRTDLATHLVAQHDRPMVHYDERLGIHANHFVSKVSHQDLPPDRDSMQFELHKRRLALINTPLKDEMRAMEDLYRNMVNLSTGRVTNYRHALVHLAAFMDLDNSQAILDRASEFDAKYNELKYVARALTFLGTSGIMHDNLEAQRNQIAYYRNLLTQSAPGVGMPRLSPSLTFRTRRLEEALTVARMMRVFDAEDPTISNNAWVNTHYEELNPKFGEPYSDEERVTAFKMLRYSTNTMESKRALEHVGHVMGRYLHDHGVEQLPFALRQMTRVINSHHKNDAAFEYGLDRRPPLLTAWKTLAAIAMGHFPESKAIISQHTLRKHDGEGHLIADNSRFAIDALFDMLEGEFQPHDIAQVIRDIPLKVHLSEEQFKHYLPAERDDDKIEFGSSIRQFQHTMLQAIMNDAANMLPVSPLLLPANSVHSQLSHTIDGLDSMILRPNHKEPFVYDMIMLENALEPYSQDPRLVHEIVTQLNEMAKEAPKVKSNDMYNYLPGNLSSKFKNLVTTKTKDELKALEDQFRSAKGYTKYTYAERTPDAQHLIGERGTIAHDLYDDPVPIQEPPEDYEDKNYQEMDNPTAIYLNPPTVGEISKYRAKKLINTGDLLDKALTLAHVYTRESAWELSDLWKSKEADATREVLGRVGAKVTAQAQVAASKAGEKIGSTADVAKDLAADALLATGSYALEGAKIGSRSALDASWRGTKALGRGIGSSISAGASAVGSGISSGISSGASLIGSGIKAGAGAVGSGIVGGGKLGIKGTKATLGGSWWATKKVLGGIVGGIAATPGYAYRGYRWAKGVPILKEPEDVAHPVWENPERTDPIQYQTDPRPLVDILRSHIQRSADRKAHTIRAAFKKAWMASTESQKWNIEKVLSDPRQYMPSLENLKIFSRLVVPPFMRHEAEEVAVELLQELRENPPTTKASLLLSIEDRFNRSLGGMETRLRYRDLFDHTVAHELAETIDAARFNDPYNKNPDLFWLDLLTYMAVG